MTNQNAVRRINVLMIPYRLVLAFVFATMFITAVNPLRMSELIPRNITLFTGAISFSTISEAFIRPLDRGWITAQPLYLLMIGAIVTALAVSAFIIAFCISLGNNKMRRLCTVITGISSVAGLIGVTVLRIAYSGFESAANIERVQPVYPLGITVYYVIFTAAMIYSVIMYFAIPKPEPDERPEMDPKYKLFLMIFPFLILVALFAYLPLWGWRYAFFDYRPGFALSMDEFVGFKWFEFLFTNSAFRSNIGRVMTNTFAMSGIGLATSWLPVVFAIFLTEVRSSSAKRWVQTLTTIPNFISWVLVYSVAFALFSSEGFINWLLISLGFVEEGTNFLLSGDNIWLKMWAWGTWKGLGWSAIIYIAGISGIDPQLYEAATVDGAGRFEKMWHVTVPGISSTFFVLLLLSISNILSNGMDQYFVFSNAANKETIEVLDLYVFNIGIGDGSNIPLATLVGMLKSLISVTLLFGANRLSKLTRGESIV